jgi:hypothetical protein
MRSARVGRDAEGGEGDRRLAGRLDAENEAVGAILIERAE